MTTRNDRAVTPLQLVVTIPDAFRSKLSLGSFSALIYDFIPLEDSIAANMTHKGDLEKQVTHENSDQSYWPLGDAAERAGIRFLTRHRSKFPPNYATFFDLLTTAWIPVSIAVRWIRVLLLIILKQMFSGVVYLEQQKIKHKQAMELVQYLAKDPSYWDFIVKGRTAPSEEETADSIRKRKPTVSSDDSGKMTRAKSMLGDTKNSDSRRWDESPLTLGAKMGLHEFVEQILKVCPQSAIFLDFEGRNILQVAIQNGQEKIVGIVESMVTGTNPVLPSWLLSSIDKNTKNTILHFAAEKMEKEDASPLQMQKELQWFERVKKLVPKDLEYSRNEGEKTAHELFTENHKDMVKDAKVQLVEIGKTCSGLVAAVVFASSFSIPGDQENGNPTFYHKTAFKVFSHSYVVGLSCASTALVLFLTLVNSPYREQDFRRSLPTRYFFAYVSLFLALVSLLVAFSCNIYLNIYGGRKAQTSEILPLVFELTIFPALCIFVLLYRGSDFGLAAFLRRFWH
ncbi:uncharacterized protein LOC109837451 isoform X2 [Asparagus officinalis]|nr:uncharacterized protein LOC109837451 isoform X2 [Asparagus officinalis]